MMNPNFIAFTASEISAYMRKDRDRPASDPDKEYLHLVGLEGVTGI